MSLPWCELGYVIAYIDGYTPLQDRTDDQSPSLDAHHRGCKYARPLRSRLCVLVIFRCPPPPACPPAAAAVLAPVTGAAEGALATKKGVQQAKLDTVAMTDGKCAFETLYNFMLQSEKVSSCSCVPHTARNVMLHVMMLWCIS
jgi:hypothetical protein